MPFLFLDAVVLLAVVKAPVISNFNSKVKVLENRRKANNTNDDSGNCGNMSSSNIKSVVLFLKL